MGGNSLLKRFGKDITGDGLTPSPKGILHWTQFGTEGFAQNRRLVLYMRDEDATLNERQLITIESVQYNVTARYPRANGWSVYGITPI